LKKNKEEDEEENEDEEEGEPSNSQDKIPLNTPEKNMKLSNARKKSAMKAGLNLKINS